VAGWGDAKNPSQLKEFIDLVVRITKRPMECISCGTEDGDIITWPS